MSTQAAELVKQGWIAVHKPAPKPSGGWLVNPKTLPKGEGQIVPLALHAEISALTPCECAGYTSATDLETGKVDPTARCLNCGRLILKLPTVDAWYAEFVKLGGLESPDRNMEMSQAFKNLVGCFPNETNPEKTGIVYYMVGMLDEVGQLWAEVMRRIDER